MNQTDPMASLSRAAAWRWFVVQQIVVFLVSAAALWAVGALTGRRLHGLQDAPTITDLASYLIVTCAIVAGTAAMLRRALRDPSATLAIAPTAARLRDFAVAFGVGLGANSLPWLVPALLGQVELRRFEVLRWQPIAVGIAIALANALFEEATMRAFPMQIFRHRSATFRLVVPALAFAAQHFVGEPPTLQRFAYLGALGVLFGLAWLVRPHAWCSGGLHAGYFYASLVAAGHADAGSWLGVSGDLSTTYEVADTALVAAAVVVIAVVVLRTKRSR